MAPITVTSSPEETWARAPTSRTRATTDWTSSSVASAFITIIMGSLVPFGHYEEYGAAEARGVTSKAPGRAVCGPVRVPDA